jgi:GNAT superfamily N-acetyltransferase
MAEINFGIFALPPVAFRRTTDSLPYIQDHSMLRHLTIEDMDRAAAVYRMSFDQALPTLAGLHTPDEDRRFFRERLFADCQLWGRFDETDLVGFIAFREGWIEQFYLLPSAQGKGAGRALLDIAKTRFRRLSLWTFQRNTRARRFYEKHGFKLVEVTDGSRNEEREPDAKYSWSSDQHRKE